MESLLSQKIYVVDDDVISQKLITFHLTKLGYRNVVSFNNGTSALDSLHEQPKVIFLDHHMDDLSGFEVLKKIKRFDPNIFVVMFSGQNKISTAVDALKYGAFDYIIKDDNAIERISSVMLRISLAIDKIEQAKPSIWKKIAGYV